MMLKSAAAGPVGRRLSCSQFCSVLTLTPIKCANSDCERLVRSRMTRTPAGRIIIRRCVLRIRVEQQDHLPAYRPVTLRIHHLDGRAEVGIRGDPVSR